jgi:hypothetical protein
MNRDFGHQKVVTPVGSTHECAIVPKLQKAQSGEVVGKIHIR